MWKYRCKNQLLSLLLAFLAGVLLMLLTMSNSSYVEMLREMLPSGYDEVLRTPWLLYLSGGFLTAGICNVFLIGNMLAAAFNLSPLFWFLIVMVFPSYAIMAGIIGLPIVVVINLYGWLSLKYGNRGLLRARNISSDDEIVRIYMIHHPLQEKYKPMAVEARKTMTKISLIYALGIAAVFCVMFLVDNIFICMMAIFLYMFAFQYLNRAKAQAFLPISSLLYQDCDPEACLSALIYYCQRGSHYRLSNQALFAMALIYLDDPSLAQDVLISYPRGNANSVLTYWSLMAYTYYLLKDEHGLERCKEAVAKIKPGMGAMGLMIKSEEQNAIENKIRLMNRDFNACKQYYLDKLKHSTTPLSMADCEYYIALISFVQEDYPLAELYFQKTIQNGGKLYFVKNAKNYLAKIQAMGIDTEQALVYRDRSTPAASHSPESQPEINVPLPKTPEEELPVIDVEVQETETEQDGPASMQQPSRNEDGSDDSRDSQ